MDHSQLASEFAAEATAEIRRVVGAGARHFEQQSRFAVGRLEEGFGVGRYLEDRYQRPLRVLDLGAGNGGVALALATFPSFSVHAVDIVPNPVFKRIRERLQISCTQTVGSGHDLPYGEASFDAVVCLETLEHVPNPRALGREVMRVLRPGGVCMLTTPARLKFAFMRDPHFGIRGLLLFPDFLQRIAVTRIFRLTRDYDVVHIFWSLRGIARLFPGCTAIEPLFNHPRPPRSLWFRFRGLLWDRIVIAKA